MPDVLAPYALTFSRIALGLVFAASSIGKLRDFPVFARTVENFQVLPRQIVQVCAYIFLGGEITVVVLMILGSNSLLLAGFLMAILLLSVFCVALFAVLIRRLQVPCNCFGSSQRPASSADIWRNVGFLACAFVGIASLTALSDTATNINLLEAGLLGMMALVFVALSVYLGEVMEALRAS
jgi:uncharacterized membrane protein YphA (DoxX/SURF4 family)